MGIETDYLVVGAGALGMAFVDTLIEHSDADVVMVDRRHRPGGHWLVSYPFVQLHQPSRYYGVDSTSLGQDRIERDGDDAEFYERASGAEIAGYFDEIMRHRFLASGRVRFFPMSDYLGDRRFRSLVTDRVTDVTVRRHVVDATYMASRVPATDPPPFDVAGGVRCVPVGALATLEHAAPGYVIIGGGKTALDAICWLLDRDTDPEQVTWIRPRDTWILNRAFFQPGQPRTFEGVVRQLEAMVGSESVDEVYERLEADGVMLRTDRTVVPTMMKGGTVSVRELEQLRRIENVVRLGHVERIEPDRIVLEHGSIATTPDHLHVHCAASGLGDNPPRRDLHRRHHHPPARDAREPDVVGRAAGRPREHGQDDRGEEPAVPARGHAAHAVRLPAHGDGRDPHGDGVAGGACSPGVRRSLAAQPVEWLGRERRPRHGRRAPRPILRSAVSRARQAAGVRGTGNATGTRGMFEPAEGVDD